MPEARITHDLACDLEQLICPLWYSVGESLGSPGPVKGCEVTWPQGTRWCLEAAVMARQKPGAALG